MKCYIVYLLCKGTLNEWDTVSLCCTSYVDALGSPIWCLDSDAAMERLAVGTDDGKVFYNNLL